MRISVLTFCLCFSTVCADDLSDAVRQATSEVASSTVRIRTIASPGADNLRVSSQITTGVAISETEVLTSVFGFSSDPAAVFVEDAEGQRMSATIVARDHVRKLVLLKSDSAHLTPVKVDESETPPVGAWTVALGRLFPGNVPAMSVGIISAVNRIHGLAIQTDAKISPVNYGGPLVDLHGHVVGILVPLAPSDSGEQIRAGVEWYDSGIGFAIPMKDALVVAEELRSGNDRSRGVMGIKPSTRNPLEAVTKVETVYPKSPAEEAGVQAGDRIVALNDRPVDRFGIFDAAVKSSYAGDRVKLSVLRDAQPLEFEMILSDRLERPKKGFVGLLVGEPVDDDEDSPFGMRVYPFPDTPAANAGIPDGAIITQWGDKDLSTARDFQVEIQKTMADTNVSVGFRTADSDQIREVSLLATVRPRAMLPVSDAIRDQITNGYQDEEWTRSEEDLGEEGKVWIYAPAADPERSSGLIILLSESDSPQQAVLTQWRDVCRQHNLILVVPSNSDGGELSREDMALLPLALGKAVPGRGIEVSRSVVVATENQQELCTELLFSPRLRQIRAAVYVNCWPGVSGTPAQALARKNASVLLFQDTIDSRQLQALREQSLRQLNEAGVWAIEQPKSAENGVSVQERIGLWTFGLQAR